LGPYGHWLQERGLYERFHQDYLARKAKGWDIAAHDSVLPAEFFADTYIGDRAVQWLDGITHEYPWHLFVSFAGPHDPFDPPTPYADRYRNAAMPPPLPVGDALGRNGRRMETSRYSAEQVLLTRRQYCASITAIDDAIGRILAALDRRGEADRTIVVFASDHGELLGDHGLYTKSAPYESCLRVPLIVAGPGVEQGASDALVELLDVNATLCDLAGVPPLEHVDARSFAPVLRGTAREHRSEGVALLQRLRVIRTATYKLVQNVNAETELYDLAADPGEQRNIAPREPDRCRALAARLLERLTRPVFGDSR